MATKNKSKSNKSSKSSSSAAAKASTKEAQVSKVTSHAGLVEALKSYETSKEQTKSYLIDVATIVQEEQLSKAEVVLSLMEARGIEKSTADSQYSRMKKLFTDPDTLEALRNGDIDLKQAREATVKKQKNKSAKVEAQNNEKKFSKAVQTIVTVAKAQGTDLATILNTIKSAANKAGLK